jgi:DHA1 family bicyclomycin/chloramphenicol resistance-like MFS transporter
MKPLFPLAAGSLPHLALLAGMAGTTALSVDIALPALPTIAAHFGASAAEAQLTIGMFLAGLAAGTLVVGPIADRFGRRAVALIGLTLFALGGVSSVLAPSIETLIIARLLQGVGAASGRVVAPAVIRDRFEGAAGARLLSQMMLMVGMAPLLSPIIGSVLMQLFDFRAIFVTLAIVGVVLVIGAMLGLEETLRRPDRDALHPQRLVSNARRFFTTRECVANGAIQSACFCAMYAYIAASPFVLIQGFGVPHWGFAFFFGSSAVMLMVGNAINARTVRRRGLAANRRSAVTVAACGGVLGAVIMKFAMQGTIGIVLTMIPVWIFYAANGMVMPTATAGVMEPHPDMAGLSAAILGAMQMGAGVIVGYLVTRLYDGTPLSMAGAMAFLTVAAWCVDRFALPRRTGS